MHFTSPKDMALPPPSTVLSTCASAPSPLNPPFVASARELTISRRAFIQATHPASDPNCCCGLGRALRRNPFRASLTVQQTFDPTSSCMTLLHPLRGTRLGRTWTRLRSPCARCPDRLPQLPRQLPGARRSFILESHAQAKTAQLFACAVFAP